MFDIACTLIDIMACAPLSPTPYEMDSRAYLNHLVSLISSLWSGQAGFLPPLQNKIAEELPSYQLQLQPSTIYCDPSQTRTLYPGDSIPYAGSSSWHTMSGMHNQESGLSLIQPSAEDKAVYTTFKLSTQYRNAAIAGGLPG
jgi:hypothetical protein